MREKIHDTIRAVSWAQERLVLLDQRRLPQAETWLALDEAAPVADAIRDMVVRGAPAIGITAAYGVVLAAGRAWARSREGWREQVEMDIARLAAARPTAVNLFWALDHMRACMAGIERDPVLAVLPEGIHDGVLHPDPEDHPRAVGLRVAAVDEHLLSKEMIHRCRDILLGC